MPKTATQAEIKKAYMRIARESHPDRGGDAEVFKAAQHAYEVLSDPERRERYDRHGEAGEDEGDGGMDPHDIFAAMFGGGGGGGRGGGGRGPQGPRKGEATTHPLHVTLADCFLGKSVKIAVTKTILEEDAAGPMMDRAGKRYRQKSEREVLDVLLERGAKHGQRLVFAGKGDVRPGFLPGDVVLVVQVKEHAVFQRRGADLIMKKELSLYESLAGFRFELTHLDGRKIVIASEPGRVTPPEDVRQVRDEGMPVLGNSHVRGALFVTFAVTFPERLALTPAMSKVLGGILPGSPAPPKAEVGVPELVLEDVDREAREARERLAKEHYDSDEEAEGQRGGGGVACAQQ